MAKERTPASDDGLGFVPDDSADLGFVPDDGQEQKVHIDFEPDPAAPVGEQGIISGAVKGARGLGKILDYARGVTGGPALAFGLEKLTGKDVFKKDELKNSAKWNNLDTYPSSAELMERAGVPQGAKISDYTDKIPKDGLLDITLRGAGGFGVDAATDPLTYLSFGANSVGKGLAKEGAEKLAKGGMQRLLEMPAVKQATAMATAPSRAMSNMGKKFFSWGITPIEQAGEKFGKEAVADTMYKHGIKGTARTIERKIGETTTKLKSARDEILDAADKAGAQVNRNKAFNDFNQTLEKMVDERRLSREEADKIFDQTVGNYMKGDMPGTKLATQWKTDVNKSLPKRAWDVTQNPNIGQALDKSVSKGLKEAVEKTVGKFSSPQAQAELIKKNRELGELLSVRSAAAQMADVAERRYAFTPWDIAAGGGMGMGTGNPAKGIALLGAKKLLEVGRMPSVRTTVGSAMRDVGEGSMAPFLDTLLRRSTANSLRKGEKKDEQK